MMPSTDFQVLKKEIDVFQLQWYGYCLFRALASLHKQVRVPDTVLSIETFSPNSGSEEFFEI